MLSLVSTRGWGKSAVLLTALLVVLSSRSPVTRQEATTSRTRSPLARDVVRHLLLKLAGPLLGHPGTTTHEMSFRGLAGSLHREYLDIPGPYRTLLAMSERELAGQVLMVGVAQEDGVEEVAEMVRELQPAGILLLGHNFSSPEAAARIVNRAQQASRIPLLVAVDQEGGEVQRFSPWLGATPLPASLWIGRTGVPERARTAGRLAAAELKAIGANMNLAPVADLHHPANYWNEAILTRCYGEDPDVVARFSEQFVRGTEAEGVISVIKHFPGGGGVDCDPHDALPVVSKGREALLSRDVAPFQHVIRRGAPVVMVGHPWYPALDPIPRPASSSPAVMQELLRERLGFEGLAVTDDLAMGAATGRISLAKAGLESLQAGADLLVMAYAGDSPEVDSLRSTLLQSIRTRTETRARLLEAACRVLTLKQKFGLTENQRVVDAGKVRLLVGTPEHRAAAAAMLEPGR